MSDNAQPGQQFFGVHVSSEGRVMIFAGGIPLQRDSQVVGAVGLSGGTGEQTRRWPRPPQPRYNPHVNSSKGD
ncbi:MAG: heme-binding protein [Rubrobacter sp.]|nr:heme-binding protein [Rubrobacter sp.]